MSAWITNTCFELKKKTKHFYFIYIINFTLYIFIHVRFIREINLAEGWFELIQKTRKCVVFWGTEFIGGNVYTRMIPTMSSEMGQCVD